MLIHVIENNAGDNKDEVIIVFWKITNAMKINEQKRIVMLSLSLIQDLKWSS